MLTALAVVGRLHVARPRETLAVAVLDCMGRESAVRGGQDGNDGVGAHC